MIHSCYHIGAAQQCCENALQLVEDEPAATKAIVYAQLAQSHATLAVAAAIREASEHGVREATA